MDALHLVRYDNYCSQDGANFCDREGEARSPLGAKAAQEE